MTDCAAEWSGAWGTAYTARNRVDWRARVPFWADILDRTGARSVYEVGCNAGWNLTALKYADPLVQVYGEEINSTALYQARTAGLEVHNPAPPLPDEVPLKWALRDYELTFTAGVLIHIPPKDLKRMMQRLVSESADYVLAVEYAADTEEEVNYRGREGMLWRRPYGKLYQDLGLKLVREWDAGPGFDRCLATLLRKP